MPPAPPPDVPGPAPSVPVRVHVLGSPPFQENTWIVWREGALQCLVVDPGFLPEQIEDWLDEHALVPAALLLTHGHADHIAGNACLKRRWPDAPLVIGAGDAPALTDPVLNLSAPFGTDALVVSPPADRLVRDGERLAYAGFEIRVSEIPGHSPGHVVYLLADAQPPRVFGGDVLFAGSIGRTDFPGGNLRKLLDGIRRKLFVLPDDTLVYPGHGPSTTIGTERRTNPFCGAADA